MEKRIKALSSSQYKKTCQEIASDLRADNIDIIDVSLAENLLDESLIKFLTEELKVNKDYLVDRFADDIFSFM